MLSDKTLLNFLSANLPEDKLSWYPVDEFKQLGDESENEKTEDEDEEEFDPPEKPGNDLP